MMVRKDDDASEREVLSAKVSSQAAEGWRSFCLAHGVSLTAMLEVAGLELAAETMPPSEEGRLRMVLKAREVDMRRRSRKRTRRKKD